MAAIAQGFSLLSPKISVIDPSTGATLGVDAHPDRYGDIGLASVLGVQAGHRYVIAVTGATNDVFSVGSYGIQLGFFGGTPRLRARTPSRITPHSPGHRPRREHPADPGEPDAPLGAKLSTLLFQVSQPGLVLVASLGANILVVDSTGHHLVGGSGLLGFHESQAWGRYYVLLTSPNNAPVDNYAFAVRTPTTSGSSISIRSISALTSSTVSVAPVETTHPTPKPKPVAIATPRGHHGRPARSRA